jgi:hypothetical protein
MDGYRSVRIERAAVSANDEERLFVIPPGMVTLVAAEATTKCLLDAPADLPLSDDAALGLQRMLNAVDPRLSGAAAIAHAIASISRKQALLPAEGALKLALHRRAGRHRLYLCAIHAGRLTDTQATQCRLTLQALAARCLIRLFDPRARAGRTEAAIAAALEDAAKDSPAMQGMESSSRWAREATSAIARLQKAAEKAPKVALNFGLRAPESRPDIKTDPIRVFNRAFRRRMANLTDFSTMGIRAGAGGYGTVALDTVRAAGQQMLAGWHAGDPRAALLGIEIITRLPTQSVQGLPISVNGAAPHDALAYIDLRAGEFRYRLYYLEEGGARPSTGTDDLYEATVQVVPIPLPESLVKLLRELEERRRDVQHPGPPLTLGDLLGGDVGHHPREAVHGDSIYRCTARRLQDSLVGELLRADHARWPVSLATVTRFLVSKGRRSYGACRLRAIHRAVLAQYELLGWPVSPSNAGDELVGSFVSPTKRGIRRAAMHLMQLAELTASNDGSIDAVIEQLNAHAAWLAFLLALCLALRNSTSYTVRLPALLEGQEIHVNDKAVHAVSGPAIVIPSLLADCLESWRRLCIRAVGLLRGLDDERASSLADRIESRLNDAASISPVFVIDPTLALTTVCTRTWRTRLPARSRLRENFGRHFIPLHLMDRGLPQQTIDVQMRHQVESLHPGASTSTRISKSTQRALRAALDDVIADLALAVPSSLRHG